MSENIAKIPVVISARFCGDCPCCVRRTGKVDGYCYVYCTKLKKNVYENLPWDKTSSPGRREGNLDLVPDNCPYLVYYDD